VLFRSPRQDARSKLLNAALKLIRAKGYAATSVDELCHEAGVTKGAFFHHFHSKDELGAAAAQHWSKITTPLFAEAPFHALPDPLDRLLGYVDLRLALMQGGIPDFTCLVGTMVQEIYEAKPAIREACAASITDHARSLEADIAAAIAGYGTAQPITAQSLALHTQAVIQGAYILAKATGSADTAADSIRHLRRYIELLFNSKPNQETFQ